MSHRDVLEHYFGGVCPFCDGAHDICPGCGGISQVYPDIFGGCGVDQSCPACMGLDFAIDDKHRLRYIEQLVSSLYGSVKAGGCEEIEGMLAEILDLTQERYEFINDMRAEMGLRLVNVDKMVKDTEDEFREWLKE